MRWCLEGGGNRLFSYFWIWPKHLWTETRPGPFAQSWDFSSAKVTSVFFFPLRTTISVNLAWLLSLLFSMKKIRSSIFVAVPFTLNFGSNLGGRSFNPWVVTWTNAGTDMCEAWCPGFLFPAVPGVYPHGSARAGCNIGGKQMSTPRLLIWGKTLNCSGPQFLTCKIRWLDWTTGFLCPKEPLEMPQDLPIRTQVSHGQTVSLYMKFRVTFCLSNGSHCSETSVKIAWRSSNSSASPPVSSPCAIPFYLAFCLF